MHKSYQWTGLFIWLWGTNKYNLIVLWNLIITRSWTRKITLLYQVSHYIRVQKQRNIKSWDQQNYLVITGFCYIRPLYNEVPLYFYAISTFFARHGTLPVGFRRPALGCPVRLSNRDMCLLTEYKGKRKNIYKSQIFQEFQYSGTSLYEVHELPCYIRFLIISG